MLLSPVLVHLATKGGVSAGASVQHAHYLQDDDVRPVVVKHNVDHDGDCHLDKNDLVEEGDSLFFEPHHGEPVSRILDDDVGLEEDACGHEEDE